MTDPTKLIAALLGDRVRRAFRLATADPALRGDGLLCWKRALIAQVAVVPHPSAVNRWWNDPKNVERARRFLRRLARERSAG